MTRTPAQIGFREVAAELRDAIVVGTYQPGMRLPTLDRLKGSYGVARPTLVRALDVLKQDGFIRTDGRRGTFVVDRPPHLVRYGLVFASHPGTGRDWNRFWETLRQQAAVVASRAGVEIPVFLRVTGGGGEGDEALRAELAANRLGGLIVVGRDDLMRSPLIQDAAVPKVAIFDADAPMPRVYIDHQSFIDHALDTLVARGRRRIAVITTRSDAWEGFEPAMAARDLESKPFWRLMAPLGGAAPLVRLLFDPDNTSVPDGLVIADDNLVEDALGGLIQAGVRVPHDVEVVAHCNWPAPVQSTLPVVRLGYDVREVLECCMERLVDQREQRSPPKAALVTAVTSPLD